MSEVYQQIVAAYERDQARTFVPVTADDLPLSYEAMTNEWLTAVLCKNIPGAAVVSHQRGAPDNGTANRLRLSVAYNAVGTTHHLPTALFLKATHGLPNRLIMGLTEGARIETVFYRDIRPLLDIEAPVGYHANYDPVSFNSIIILGDLTGVISQFCNHRTEMTRARAESQIRLLAKMHGNVYADARLAAAVSALPKWPEYFATTAGFGMESGSKQGFNDSEAVIPARLFKRAAEVWPATVASVELQRQLQPTLAHGDLHLKNWYVAANGDMGLGDWQCCTRGHWSRDVAYTISTALEPEDRRAWEQDLFKLYLQLLAEAGGPVVTFNEGWTQYRQQLMSALAWWTPAVSPGPGLPDMQPKEVCFEFIRRMTIAIDDLDSLDAF